MSLKIAEEHGLVYTIKQPHKPELPSVYARKPQLVEAIQKHILKQITGFNGDKFLNYDEITLALFHLLMDAKLISIRTTPVAGDYYKYDPEKYQQFRANFLSSHPLHKLASEIGDRYFLDAFKALEARVVEGEDEAKFDEAERSVGDLNDGPNSGALSTETSKAEFVGEVNMQISKLEQSDLSNSDKSTARGYLVAAKALAETPEPPVDLIWTILNRANSIAGIASFFVALIVLMLTAGS